MPRSEVRAATLSLELRRGGGLVDRSRDGVSCLAPKPKVRCIINTVGPRMMTNLCRRPTAVARIFRQGAPLRAAAVLLASALLLSACATATPEHVLLANNARDSITSTEIVAPIRQSEIYLVVPKSNVAMATGGGLLPALIDAGIDNVRTSRAEAAVKPLRNSVVDFNFDDMLRDELRRSLSKVSWTHVNDARVIKEVTTGSLDHAIADSKASAVLMATTDYHLSNDGGTLFIVINAGLFANSDALRALEPSTRKENVRSDPANALYRNSFMFEAGVPNASNSRDVNMATWSANQGEAIRATLKFGVARLAQLMAADLQGADVGSLSSGQAVGTILRHDDGTVEYALRSGSPVPSSDAPPPASLGSDAPPAASVQEPVAAADPPRPAASSPPIAPDPPSANAVKTCHHYAIKVLSDPSQSVCADK